MGLKKNYFKILIFTISFLLYLISFTKPAISSIDLQDGTLSGFATFIIGGIAILGGGFFEWIIWLANPLYIISLILVIFKSCNSAKKISIIATILALSFSTWDEILVSEAGTTGNLDSLGTGYWLWVASLTLSTIGIFYITEKYEKRENVQ